MLGTLNFSVPQARGIFTVQDTKNSACSFRVDRLELTDGGTLEWWAGMPDAKTAEDVLAAGTLVSSTAVAGGAYGGKDTMQFALRDGVRWEDIGVLALVDPTLRKAAAHVVVQKLGPGAAQVRLGCDREECAHPGHLVSRCALQGECLRLDR